MNGIKCFTWVLFFFQNDIKNRDLFSVLCLSLYPSLVILKTIYPPRHCVLVLTVGRGCHALLVFVQRGGAATPPPLLVTLLPGEQAQSLLAGMETLGEQQHALTH